MISFFADQMQVMAAGRCMRRDPQMKRLRLAMRRRSLPALVDGTTKPVIGRGPTRPTTRLVSINGAIGALRMRIA
jgi:hypothetical protein